MSRRAVDLVAVECARIGCPEWWVRELLAEAGYPMTTRQWRRYWLVVSRLAQDAATRALA